MSQFCQIELVLVVSPVGSAPKTQSNDLEPFLLASHVGVVELCVALSEVDDSFHKSDDAHDDRSRKEKD